MGTRLRTRMTHEDMQAKAMTSGRGFGGFVKVGSRVDLTARELENGQIAVDIDLSTNGVDAVAPPDRPGPLAPPAPGSASAFSWVSSRKTPNINSAIAPIARINSGSMGT